MSQRSVCSYCYLIQQADKAEHLKITPEDLERYKIHLRVQHGVTLAAEIPV